MELQKINVKLFVENPDSVSLTDFIDIFHGWIQATDGDYHDVADYSHLTAGPGVILVAREANISIDESDNRRGLLYSQKSFLDGSNQIKLRWVLRSTLENFRKLEREPKLGGKLKLLGNEVLIAINDRLLAPNNDESFAVVATEVEPLARNLFGDAEFILEREPEKRRIFALRIRASRSLTVDELLNRLNNN